MSVLWIPQIFSQKKKKKIRDIEPKSITFSVGEGALSLCCNCIQGSANHSPQDKSAGSRFVNKVLLQHSHDHLFMYCLWLHSLQRQSCMAETNTIMQNLKQIGSFLKTFVDPCNFTRSYYIVNWSQW